ncbi:MAG: ABC transporter ATP-binding protein [Pirellulales bacterium]
MLVETHELTKRYGRVTALDRCMLSITEGEIFGLLGPNGSGKTTLLRLLMGYLRPTAGSAKIDGLDCYRDSVAVHQRVAYLPGEAKLVRQMRGREALVFFARVRPDGDLNRALALAERLELDLSRPVSLMSTGMRQKTALAAVLSSHAPLLILDEPTSNLDPTARREVLAIVVEAQAAGKTVLFSSHVLGEVEETCARVVILRRGQVVHEQTMHELRRQHRIRARLTGPLPAVPEHFNGALQIFQPTANDVLIDTPGELAPLLGWLATAPLAEVRIEPVRLQTVYERFHGGTR